MIQARHQVQAVFFLGFLMIGLGRFSTPVSANVGDFLGFGARTMALGGAGVTGDTSGFGAYHNPATLASRSKERLALNWGLVFVRPSFSSINNVVTQNTYVADAVVNGSVDTQYKDTLGQVLGLSFKVLPDFGDLTLGLVTFLPLTQLAYMDSGQPYAPEYFMYRSRTQRPQVELGAGARLLPGLRFGAGLHAAFGLTGNASIFLNTAANTTSTMTFSASLTPLFSGYLGLLWTPGEQERGSESSAAEGPWNLGLVYRAPASSGLTMPMIASARILGPGGAPDFVFTASSVLYYDPAAWEAGVSFKAGDHRWVAQADYQYWTGYKTAAIALSQGSQAAGASGTLIQISPGVLPSYTLVNIFVPRVGWEWNLNPSHTLRVGYSYRSSVLKNVSSGVGNYLDPPKHVITAGWGFHFDSFLGFAVPSQLDLALNYQQLLTQQITKTPGDELGNTSGSKIGSPGYNAGGRLFGGAVSLALAF
jgi:hypothetical protein